MTDELGNTSHCKLGTHIADAPHPFGLWDEREDELWSVDNRGNHIGGFGLQLMTREMAKFVYLYLKQGQWEDALVRNGWIAKIEYSRREILNAIFYLSRNGCTSTE